MIFKSVLNFNKFCLTCIVLQTRAFSYRLMTCNVFESFMSSDIEMKHLQSHPAS